LNNFADIFHHDLVTGRTIRVSVDSNGGEANAHSRLPAISGNGRFVAFASSATNLVPGDTNQAGDVFVHDRLTGATVRASVAPDGSDAAGESFHPDLDADGHLVAFDSFAGNLVPGDDDSTLDVFVRNLTTGTTEPVSMQPAAASGVLVRGGDATISSDGRFVGFSTREPALVPGDANGFVEDVVVFDRTTHAYEIVSRADGAAGAQGDDDSSNPFLSADGRFVSFTSRASNLVAGDTNFRDDAFVRDRLNRTTARISVGSNGEEGDLDSLAGPLDADGQVASFWSDSSTLVPESGQSFFAYDVFVRDARPAADLSVALGDSPDPAAVRGDLTYTATIANAGPASATGATLVADIPADAIFVSASGASCTRGGKGKADGTLTCTVGTLAPGSSATVSILVHPARVGTLTLNARVYADQPDPARANNAASESTTVNR
jgi:uncharacterized repeat protein (TIGR01451 family)